MDIIDDFIVRLQAPLFILTETFIEEPLTSKLEQFARLLCSVDISKHIASPFSHRMGRKIMDRRCIARAFLAKAVLGYSTTKMLIEHLHTNRALRLLCGFEIRESIPSAPTFSRAFRGFAKMNFGDKAHMHIMFGVLALFADQMYKIFRC